MDGIEERLEQVHQLIAAIKSNRLKVNIGS
jgi:hypothetical protein